MKKGQLRVRWLCESIVDEFEDDTEGEGCGLSLETIESLTEWKNISCYVDCPSCGMRLNQATANFEILEGKDSEDEFISKKEREKELDRREQENDEESSKYIYGLERWRDTINSLDGTTNSNVFQGRIIREDGASEDSSQRRTD